MKVLKYCLCWALWAMGFSVWAYEIDEPKANDGCVKVGWTPIQLGVYTSAEKDNYCQLFPGTADVYGVALGALNLRQQSAIVSFAPVNEIMENYLFAAGLNTFCGCNYGASIGLLNRSVRNYGVSAGLVNIDSDIGIGSTSCPIACGIQIGLFNLGGGIQIGLLNCNPRGPLWFLPLPGVNFPCRERLPWF